MKQFHLGLSLCLLLPALSAGGSAPDSPAALSRMLDARLAQDRTGACVQAVLIDKGQVLRASRCAGTRQDGPPAQDAAFEIGSVSKTMTAFLAADLVTRGAWSLDDPIARHLPEGAELPRQGERQILLRDLLTHSSGLPSLPPGMVARDPADPYSGLDEAQLLASLGRVRLTRPIGSQVEYSNFGMMLVSLAVARAHGGDFETALRKGLFEPLGMRQAHVRPVAQRGLAQGHLPGGAPTKAWTVSPNLAGMGMVRASLDDMERYARAQLGEAPEALAAALRLTQQPLAHGFAMNWMSRPVQGHELLMHEGATGGFSAFIAVEVARQRAVVLLSDTALADLGGLGELGLAMLGVDVPLRPRRTAEPAPALRKALSGDYELAGMTLRIWEGEDGRLMAQAAGQQAFELKYDSFGDFYPQGFSALLSPLPPSRADAPVERFVWRQMGGVSEGRRRGLQEAPPTISNPAWRDWAGEFQLAPQFSLKVFERDGQLVVQGSGQPAIPAEVSGEDRIAIPAVGAVVSFERDAAGQVVAAVLQQNGQRLRGPKR